MLTLVEVHSSRGEVLSLPLGDPRYGILVQDIDGLDPVKANIVSSSFAQQDGAQYHSARRETRNIVLKLGLEPSFIGETVRGLRNSLYSIFMPKSEVKMRFQIDSQPTVEIMGRVESFECPLFVEKPEATISILCMNPDFYDPEVVLLEGLTTDVEGEYLVEYDGSVETGVKFQLLVNRTIPSGLTLNHRSASDEVSSLPITVPLINGNVLEVNTNTGEKGATVDGISMLYGVSPYGSWIQLSPGPNYISVFVEGVPVPFTLEYTNKYGGL